MTEHRTFCHPLKDDADTKQWRESVPDVIDYAIGYLRKEGLAAHAAPDMPPLNDGLEGYIQQPWRVLFAWIPPWAPNTYAGRFVVRVDTLARHLQSEEALCDTKTPTLTMN